MNAPEKNASQSLSFRVSEDTAHALERLASATDRPRSWHLEQALKAYLDVQAWQVSEIEASIAELDAGKSISHEQMMGDIKTWENGR